MKKTIASLFSALKTLSDPANSSSVLAIINTMPLSVELPHSLLSDPFFTHFLELKAAAEACLAAESRLALIKEQAANNIALTKKLAAEHDTHHQIMELIQQIKKDALAIYLKIEPKLSCLSGYLACTSHPLDSQLHCELVEQYTALLRKAVKLFDMNKTLNKLIELTTRGEDLCIALGVTGALDDLDKIDSAHLEKRISFIVSAIQGFDAVEPQLRIMQQHIGQRLTKTEVEKKINQLQQQEHSLSVMIEQAQNNRLLLKLTPEQKTALVITFQQATDKDELILSQQNKIDTLSSYFDIYSWNIWLSDAGYSAKQQKQKETVLFLQLLNEEHRLQASQRELITQQSILASLLKLHTTEIESTALVGLMQESLVLMKHIPKTIWPIDFNSYDEAIDFYLLLSRSMPHVVQVINGFKLALPKLIELHLLMKASEPLKSKSSLFLSKSLSDYQKLKIELQKKITNLALEPDEVSMYQQLCYSFIEQINLLSECKAKVELSTLATKIINIQLTKNPSPSAEELTYHQQQLAEQQQQLAHTLDTFINSTIPAEELLELLYDKEVVLLDSSTIDAQSHATDESSAAIANTTIATLFETAQKVPDLISAFISEHALSLTNTFDHLSGYTGHNVLELSSTPIPIHQAQIVEPVYSQHLTKAVSPLMDRVESIKNEVPVQTGVPVQSEAPAYNSESIASINEQIVKQLTDAPASLKSWYGQVHHALSCSNYWLSYQANQVLDDIFFELTHRDNYDVLYAYMRLCPTPEKEINSLLRLKSAIKDIDIKLLQTTDNKLFKTMYEQIQRLQNNYPLEANLLSQAFKAVFAFYLQVSKTNEPPSQRPLLLEDPRYDCLKRHRGVLKIWQFIEDLCRFVVAALTQQAQYEYQKRPCFFKTRSLELLEQADLFMHDLPALVIK